MKTSRDTSSENDVLYQFALSYRHPNPQLLDDFVRRHPSHADTLTALAIELALENLVGNEDRAVVEPSEAEPEPETAAMLSRAMSRFQNRLHAVRTAQDSATAAWPTDQAEGLRDPFALRSTEQMQIVLLRLDASPLFVMRLRDRGIDAATMTVGFIRRVAEALEEPETVVRAHFAAPAQVPLRGLYKSDMTPSAGQKLSFDEAVRTSGLSPEQQARLLAL